MKRSNDLSQLSKEDVEELEDSVTEAGQWQKASEEELKTRKIVKIKRPSDKSSSSNNPFAALGNAFMTATSAINPFKGLTALAPASTTISSSSSSSSSSSNVFSTPSLSNTSTTFNTNVMDFKGQQQTTMNNNLSIPSFALPANPPLTSSFLNKPNATTNNINIESNGNESEYKKKMTRLNQSLVQWMDHQLADNPVSIWKDSLKGYITYAKNTSDKYGEKEKTPIVITSTTIQSSKPVISNLFSTVPPAPVPAATPVSAPISFTPAPAPTVSPTPTLAPFSFSATAATTTAAPTTTAQAPFSFQFGTSTTSSAPVASITNIFSAALPAGTNPFAASNPFTNPTGSSNVFAKTLATTNPFGNIQASTGKAEPENEDEEEAEPILEPEQILKNDEDKDEILHDVNCKAFRYSVEDKEWKDMGKGSFRVTMDPITKKQRILIRNTMGRITFNAAFFKAMEFKNTGKGIRFSAVVDNNGLKNFMIKFKNEDLTKTMQILENAVKALP